MIEAQYRQILAEACAGTAFEPHERHDVQSIGHDRYFDGWIRDTRTGDCYSMGAIHYQQSAGDVLVALRWRLEKLEARLKETRDAERRNATHKTAQSN